MSNTEILQSECRPISFLTLNTSCKTVPLTSPTHRILKNTPHTAPEPTLLTGCEVIGLGTGLEGVSGSGGGSEWSKMQTLDGMVNGRRISPPQFNTPFKVSKSLGKLLKETKFSF